MIRRIIHPIKKAIEYGSINEIIVPIPLFLSYFWANATTNGMVGIEASVAMGTILGECERELMVIAHVDTTRLPEVKEYLNSDKIHVHLNDGDIKLYIRIEGTYAAAVENKK